jgi:5-methylcytosine-specific restriction protein B
VDAFQDDGLSVLQLDFVARLAQPGPKVEARQLNFFSLNQFPQMLRYFAFPDRVERMSSNGDRWRILEAFGVAKKRETRNWSDRQLDGALLALRSRLEQEHAGEILDFYDPPLAGKWNTETPPDEPAGGQPISNGPRGADSLTNAVEGSRPVNLILYGPPGTGKTFLAQHVARHS